MKEEISTLSVAFAAIDKKFKEIKADSYEDKEKMHQDMMGELASMIRNVSARLDYVANSNWDYQYSHSKGHLPAIKTASQMRKALEMCGMGEDYEVETPSIFVSASVKKGLQITASYKKK